MLLLGIVVGRLILFGWPITNSPTKQCECSEIAHAAHSMPRRRKFRNPRRISHVSKAFFYSNDVTYKLLHQVGCYHIGSRNIFYFQCRHSFSFKSGTGYDGREVGVHLMQQLSSTCKFTLPREFLPSVHQCEGLSRRPRYKLLMPEMCHFRGQ